MNPASDVWLSEANWNGDEEVGYQERFADPETGVRILRLTSQPCINHNIYPETPVSTRDGSRFIFARRPALSPAGDAGLGPATTFWIADLTTRSCRQVTDEEDAGAPIITPDNRWFYYSVGCPTPRGRSARRSIRRMSPSTFEREEIYVVPDGELSVGHIVSVSHDGSRFLAPARRRPAGGLPGVAVIDVGRGTVSFVAEGRDVLNPHPQFSLDGRDRIMVQVNDGMEVDAAGNVLRRVGPLGASLHVLDADGSNRVKLRAGSSPLERVQGHECWIPGENRLLTTLHRRPDPASPWAQDRIVAIGPDDGTRRAVGVPGDKEAFCHIHASPDGRHWVSDSNSTARIFVGSSASGRHRLFCCSGATFGSAQYTHPHPFFLGDGRTIGWNSDVTGVPHVYCARIPDGFLEALG